MFEGKKGKIMLVGLIAIIIIVLGLLTFFIVDFIRSTNGSNKENESAYAGNVSAPSTRRNTTKNTSADDEQTEATINLVEQDFATQPVAGNSVKMYKGFIQSGNIEIPKISLNLPVLADASAKAIDTSVAVNGGPGLNQVGNTVIIGHNYRDGRFFANLKNVSNGDKIYITDLAGTRVEYTVFNVYTTSPEDSAFMDRQTDGKREITLDTCTDDTQSRLIVCAREN